MYRIRIIMFLASIGFISSFALAVPAFAQTAPSAPTTNTQPQGGMWGGGRMRDNVRGQMPGAFGTVASISGTTLTVTGKVGPKGGTATTYTVDASNATVMKDGASSSLSNVAVGDTVMVAGTVNGTSITATTVRDGMPKGRPMGGPGGTWSKGPAPTTVQGNGQPIIGGSVTAINGSVLTVTNKSNATYSVETGSATIVKDGATSTLASIVTGDNVLVQGTFNGSSVTASSVTDQGAVAVQNTVTGTPMSGAGRGFFGMLGGFFSHLFGFF